MDSSCDSVGIDMPESLQVSMKEEPIVQNDTRIGVDIAKTIFQIAISLGPGRVDRQVG